MEFYTLKTFILLAQNGSFSQTAKLLHLTQPAVSQQIKGLEAEFNQILFERKGKTTQLTPAGQLLLPYAQRISLLLSETINMMLEFKGEGEGLCIGAGTTTIIFRLPEIIRDFKLLSPGSELKIKVGTSKEITELVLNGSVDFGLVTTAPSDKLQSIPLYRDEILLVTPVLWYPPFTPLRFSDLEETPLILFSQGSGFQDFLDAFFRAHNFQAKVVLELDNIEGIKQMVKSGLGLSFLPKIAVVNELGTKDLLTLKLADLDSLYRTTYLISLPDKLWTKRMMEFYSLLHAQFSSPNFPQDPTNY